MKAHKQRAWRWARMTTPGQYPILMEGWFSVCSCCPADRASWRFDSQSHPSQRWFRVAGVRVLPRLWRWYRPRRPA